MKKLIGLLMCLALPAMVAVAQPVEDHPAEEFEMAWMDEPLDAPFAELADLEGSEMDCPAEPGLGQTNAERPMVKLNLTDDQTKKLQQMRVQTQKEMIPLRGDLQTKRLDMRTEMQADKPDLVKINALIDQMAKVRADIQKKQIAMRFKMRDQLTAEQVKIWDAHKGQRVRHFIHQRRGMRGAKSPRPGRCPSM